MKCIVLISLLLLSCEKTEAPIDDNAGGDLYVSLKGGNKWKYEILSASGSNFGTVHPYDSTLMYVTLTGIFTAGLKADSILVFSILDSQFQNGQVDSLSKPMTPIMKSTSIHTDTVLSKLVYYSDSFPKTLPSMKYFLPPADSLFSNQIAVFGNYTIDDSIIHIIGRKAVNSKILTRVFSPQGRDTVIYLKNIGLYFKNETYVGGMTSGFTKIKLKTFNNASYH